LDARFDDVYIGGILIRYRGLIGVGGFVPRPPPTTVLTEKAIVFTFGPNGFFGYGAPNPNGTMWWSTCEAAAPPGQRKIDVDDLRKQLQARHGNWKDPVIQDIIEKVDVDTIYPVWTVPELPRWGEKGLVVLGDAAHALDSTSGQGCSQAFEDAKCLALLLSRFVDAGKKSVVIGSDHGDGDEERLQDAVDKSIAAFYEIRNPRLQKIVARTKLASSQKKDMGLVAEMMMCMFLWLMGKVPAIGKCFSVGFRQR
jgi:2-polyprenyl-6-methoxyphenol hydroxylase-like FAD-dependent oxidoreductase